MRIEDMAVWARVAAEARMGRGWAVLSPELREALVAREAMAIISSNEDNEGWQRAARLAALVLAQYDDVPEETRA